LFEWPGTCRFVATVDLTAMLKAEGLKLIRAHSEARTPVAKLSKLMKRSEGSLRQKARTLVIGLGHLR
jgi:hypothetical protein